MNNPLKKIVNLFSNHILTQQIESIIRFLNKNNPTMRFRFILIFLFITQSLSAQNSDNQYYITHGVFNLFKEKDNFKGFMTKMNEFGCNSALISVHWQEVYKKSTDQPNWSIIDDQVNHALKLGWKIGFRIYLGRGFYDAGRDKFWLDNESTMDFKGKPLSVYYHRSFISFCADEPLQRSLNFVKEVTQRYKYLQDSGKLIFISVTTTNEDELGYPHQNEQFPDVQRYQAIYDHSKPAMIKWIDWVSKKYKTIRTVNAAWGTEYRRMDEVEPYVNWWNPRASFTGIRGKEWYFFRHTYLKKFADDATNIIKSVDKNIKVAMESGSFTDHIGYLRGTLSFPNLTEKADYIKYNDPEHKYTADFIRSNTNKPFFTEVSVTEPRYTKENLTEYLDWNFERGASMYYFLVQLPEDLPKAEQAVRYAANKYKNRQYVRPTPTRGMTFTVSELIDNHEAVVQKWISASENGKYLVDAKMTEDILGLDKPIENPLPDIATPNPQPPPPPVIITDPNQPNQAPIQKKNIEQQVVLGENFTFNLPYDFVQDPDGFIALTELLEAPTWLKYSKYELVFSGIPTGGYAKYPIKMKYYDNRGASLVITFILEVTPPRLDVELIEADYFDVPIKGMGFMTDNREIVLGENPKLMNMIIKSNLDSVSMLFNLTGPFKYSRVSETKRFVPHSLYPEGQGFVPPIGTYTLNIKAYRKDTSKVISWKTLKFKVYNSFNPKENVLGDWLVYPNPFEAVCNIKIPDNEDFKNLNFYLFNQAGQKFEINKSSINFIDKVAYIDTDTISLSAGIYTLTIQKGEMILNRKRVVKVP
jgi:hypothetical protein